MALSYQWLLLHIEKTCMTNMLLHLKTANDIIGVHSNTDMNTLQLLHSGSADDLLRRIPENSGDSRFITIITIGEKQLHV